MSLIDIIVPAAGESVTEADIAEWKKADGEYVELDEAFVELETDKASMDLNAESAGTLHIKVEEGETVQVGDVIAQIDTAAVVPSGSSPAPVETPAAAPVEVPVAAEPAKVETTGYAAGHPSPSAAKVLAEKGVDASSVSGSGKGGRVTKADAESANAAPAVSAPKESAAPVAPTVSGSREVRREKMSRLRRTVATHLVNAQHTQAQLTTFNEVDLTEIMAIRKKYKEDFKEKYEVGLGFMSFFTKAACEALKQFPIINAQVDGDHIVYNDFCDIGIAVSSPKGLVVPVIRDAEHLTFQGIEGSIVGLAKKARSGSLGLADLEGGTFTITNGGTFGSMMSAPIVNFPQSAILGMHNIIQRPMAINGEVKIRPMMYLAVSYDHRIIDGSDAVRFLVAIKDRLEDPTKLLIGL
ncbi:2-oxoglutarate dehydrogenase complex dihydrolipoyllysine-residue succinyltransferase [bacterium]|jgi:2-oxoglutarate dehydrogenase E2 component (dihydrolipoamide succinyltransferase)|nr:2-oxoglutarate dehydrogenase complex dihydrolipoyllysine-residue succinyltransferase [bacterium]